MTGLKRVITLGIGRFMEYFMYSFLGSLVVYFVSSGTGSWPAIVGVWFLFQVAWFGFLFTKVYPEKGEER